MPLFSVIIPTFNRSQFIAYAVRTVLDQTCQDLELIVVDDGSTDETSEYLREIRDPRLIILRQEHRGVSAARNAGIQMARGEWITFLDSDDEALPYWLEELGKCVAGEAKMGVAFCGNTIIKDQGKGQVSTRNVLPEGGKALFNAGTFAIRRSILLSVEGYCESLRFSENTELIMRVMECCEAQGWGVGYVYRPLTIYHLRLLARLESGRSYYENILAAVEYILVRHGPFFICDPGAKYHYLAIAGVNAARLGRHALARRYFRLAIVQDPWRLIGYLRFVAMYFPGGARWLWKA